MKAKSKTLNIIAKLLYKKQPLKTIRQKRNLSQSELSKISGVNRCAIQAYEQRELDISKAQYDTLYSLSNSLGREVNDVVFDYKDSK
ncbi:MAG: helix-turn-helix transcriptional regulator [Erysipelotrichaceae bacterium]|nr:helix-turn-helix transcriptional regulator [Erysipelotrichaceae bacterium]